MLATREFGFGQISEYWATFQDSYAVDERCRDLSFFQVHLQKTGVLLRQDNQENGQP